MKRRLPRKTKKSILKGGILIYDIAVLPKMKTFKNIVDEFRNYKVVLWASSGAYNCGGKDINNPPTVVGNKTRIKFIDTSLTNL